MVNVVYHGTWALTPADEQLHRAGPELLWNESYYFDWAAPDGSAGGYVRLGLYPNWGVAWYWACLVRPGQPLILVADNAVPLPAPGTTSVQAAGLTAGQAITEPLRSVRVTLDATAAVLADPTAAYAGLAGAPATRLALNLDWVTDGGVYPYRDLPRYEVPCRVTGTVEAGGQTLAVAGTGERDHSWGERDWWRLSWLWTAGRLGDGTAFHGMQANVGFALGWPSFTVSGHDGLRHQPGFSARTTFGPDDLPEVSRLRLAGRTVTATPVAFAPVGLTGPDGQRARFPRALCRFDTGEADDGPAGYGWTEWNQPEGWREHGWTDLAEAPGSPGDPGSPGGPSDPGSPGGPSDPGRPGRAEGPGAGRGPGDRGSAGRPR